MSEIVTRQEQYDQGLLTTPKGRFVAPDRQVQLPTAVHSTTFDVPMSAQGAVIVHTSNVDRAKGHGIAMAPIAIMTGVLASLIAILFGAEVFTLATLIIFWAVGTLTYGALWLWNLLISPEGVMFFEAKRKWDEARDSRRERWAYYAQANGIKIPSIPPDRTILWCVVALCITSLVMFFGIFMLL